MDDATREAVTRAYAEVIDSAIATAMMTKRQWSPDTLEQLVYTAWRLLTSDRTDLLPTKFTEFKQDAPTKYPDMWNAWVVHRVTRKLLEEG